jgi:hypothetical protein
MKVDRAAQRRRILNGRAAHRIPVRQPVATADHALLASFRDVCHDVTGVARKARVTTGFFGVGP